MFELIGLVQLALGKGGAALEMDRPSKRFRASILTVMLLFLLALTAEVVAPLTVTAERKRDRVSSREDPERRARAEEFLDQLKRDEVSTKVVGGTTVPQGKYPFMAYVQIEFEPEQFGRCGGSLIDPWYVVTAAHCVVDDFGSVRETGAFALAIGKAYWPDFEYDNVYYVYDVIVHPEWDDFTFENDVAVLELDLPVPASIAKPIPLVGRGTNHLNGAGQATTVAGWGTTESGGDVSNHLLEADLNIVSDGSCDGAYGFEFVPSVMICAAYIGRDSCQGDSGGPLFARDVIDYKIKKKKGKKGKKPKKKRIPVYGDVQMGIVSWGIGCADPEYPGIYTRVSAPGINDFIVDVVN